VAVLISDIMNVIVTSKKAILDIWNNWFQKYIFRYQKWSFLLVQIELLISRIDISTSDDLIIDIRNCFLTSWNSNFTYQKYNYC